MTKLAERGLAPLFELAVARGSAQAAALLLEQSADDSLALEWTRQALLSLLRVGVRDVCEI
ncbi:MAG TPA: hypothetical protein VIW24_28035 [Aldersonia sp.]